MPADCASFQAFQKVLPQRAVVRIGNVSLALNRRLQEDAGLAPGLEAFRVPTTQAADIEVNVGWTEQLRSFGTAPAFNSGAVWTLFHKGDEYLFDFVSRGLSQHPYKRMGVDPTFRWVTLTLSCEALASRAPVSPLEYPVDELLVTNYLAVHGLGVEVHGCGLIDAETGGHLLLGHSGAGKSTTAYLWQWLRNPEILSDDRLILRIENGELWMYGTPWHGEGHFASPGKAKLNRILVLQHGTGNELIEMSRAHAAAELFARCFPPFHSSVGLQNTMEFLHRVVGSVPCYEFRFVPDKSAVEAVLGMTCETLVA